MKKISLLFFILTVVLVLSFVACEDDSDRDVSIASDNAFAEAVFDDVSAISDQAVGGGLTTFIPGFETGIMGTCATVTFDTIGSPDTVIIDFGPANCLCKDNRYRRGKIIVSYTGRYRDSGTVITTTFDEYYVNDFKVLGTKTVRNKGVNTNGNLNFDIDVNGSIIKTNNQGTLTWTSQRNREWVQGSSTLINWLDDVYLITGSANGTSAAGTSYTVTITKALQKEIAYRHIVAGTMEIIPKGFATRILDFGNGARDNIATVTINGSTFTMYLR